MSTRIAGKNNGCRWSVPVPTVDRLSEEREEVSALGTTGLNYGHHSLDEATSTLVLRAEAALTPQDVGTQSLLGPVVGGLDAWNPREGPHGRPVLEDVLAHPGDLGVTTCRSLLEESLDAGADGVHPLAEFFAVDGSIPEEMPHREDRCFLRAQFLADLLTWALAIRDLLIVAGEGGVANASPLHRIAVAGFVAVGDYGAQELCAVEKAAGNLAVSPQVEFVDRMVLAHRGPQPGFVVLLPRV